MLPTVVRELGHCFRSLAGRKQNQHTHTQEQLAWRLIERAQKVEQLDCSVYLPTSEAQCALLPLLLQPPPSESDNLRTEPEEAEWKLSPVRVGFSAHIGRPRQRSTKRALDVNQSDIRPTELLISLT